MNTARPTEAFHIAVVDLPEHLREADEQTLGVLATLLRADVTMSNEVWAEVFGHDDFRNVATNTLHSMRHQKTRRKVVLVALTGRAFAGVGEFGLPHLSATDDLGDSELVGSVFVANPIIDNTHLIDGMEVAVRADWRRRGVGSALLEAAEVVARVWGVTTLMGWGTHREGGDSADAVRPKEGLFSVSPDAGSALALARGYSLAQCERHSTQDVPSEPVALPPTPQGYELLYWRDHTPAGVKQARCRLAEAMVSDTPKGELDLEDATWTVERLDTVEQSTFELNEGLTTAVRHVATGELVGFTELNRVRDLPAVAWQEVTVVLGHHRGHGLGRVLKWANLAQCQQLWPEVERIHTWNAGENRWMLAINDELGYRIATVGGAWQKKLGQA
ncbi:GNAT family N-acetyltransferase [Aestuariimicrobium ganziense]|uniref:GNAT family N-acetyltransferase n=1 Tax=Aestuariimicrobium ganziense TaxID=2773677 RepID=UPI0019433F94|nr:GNAT family N-acetyltransferase [Aestuariimicrobium ganziense]